MSAAQIVAYSRSPAARSDQRGEERGARRDEQHEDARGDDGDRAWRPVTKRSGDLGQRDEDVHRAPRFAILDDVRDVERVGRSHGADLERHEPHQHEGHRDRPAEQQDARDRPLTPVSEHPEAPQQHGQGEIEHDWQEQLPHGRVSAGGR